MSGGGGGGGAGQPGAVFLTSTEAAAPGHPSIGDNLGDKFSYLQLSTRRFEPPFLVKELVTYLRFFRQEDVKISRRLAP